MLTPQVLLGGSFARSRSRVYAVPMSLSPAFAPRPFSLVRVEGVMTSGDLFSFDMIHYNDESEFDLDPRALEAFAAYHIDVETYKINV